MRGASSLPRKLVGMGATRWQTIWRVTLKAARSGIFTAVVFGMARAFGEALAIPDGGRKLSAVVPNFVATPAATLTSIDYGYRKYR